MNCEDITRRLSCGEPLHASEQQHLESCPECRALLAALRAPAQVPGPDVLETALQQISASLQPVRPLPSNPILILSLWAAFAILSIGIAFLAGTAGYRGLTAGRRLTICLPLLAAALLLASALVHQMLPGSRIKLRPIPLAVGVLAVLSGLYTLLFAHFTIDHFVAQGVPCLRLGLISAALSSALLALFARRGFLTSPVTACTVAGCFAGLVGVAVLALHCPVQDAAHILAWHLGAFLLAGLGGALLGLLSQAKAGL